MSGKQPLVWLCKDGVHLATEGFADELSVPDTPSMKNLDAEYIDEGGRFFARPVYVKTHKLETAT